MSYWIKERHNPQLGVYYVACGKLSVADARKHEHSLYGDNVMLRFKTEADYQAKLRRLMRKGEKVQ